MLRGDQVLVTSDPPLGRARGLPTPTPEPQARTGIAASSIGLERTSMAWSSTRRTARLIRQRATAGGKPGTGWGMRR
jgi:hypothetical protein